MKKLLLILPTLFIAGCASNDTMSSYEKAIEEGLKEYPQCDTRKLNWLGTKDPIDDSHKACIKYQENRENSTEALRKTESEKGERDRILREDSLMVTVSTNPETKEITHRWSGIDSLYNHPFVYECNTATKTIMIGTGKIS